MTHLYGESGRFYREIKIIKFCKACRIEFRPKRYSWQAAIGLCIKHRREFLKEMTKRYGWQSWSPEKKKEAVRKFYPTWLNWVKNNLNRRRKLALESYHRNKFKEKNRVRRHRATRQKIDIGV